MNCAKHEVVKIIFKTHVLNLIINLCDASIITAFGLPNGLNFIAHIHILLSLIPCMYV